MMLNDQALKYCTFFCEENIYHLISTLHCTQDISIDLSYAVIITNAAKSCELHAQRLGSGRDKAVYWDYHVILLSWNIFEKEWKIWDFDTDLGLCSNALNYLETTFPEKQIRYSKRSRFRLIPAKQYLTEFYSDRSMIPPQMVGQITFPEWPPIHAGTMTLESLVDVDNTQLPIFLDLGQLTDFLNRIQNKLNAQ